MFHWQGMATMADDRERMDVAVPSKRARLDFTKENEDETYSIISSSNSRSSDIISSINGESASTSDSGFNELTPPRSSEDELTNGGNNHANMFENFNFHGVNQAKVSDEDLQNSDNELDEDDDDDACSVGSTTSNLSGLSNLSGFSGKEWKPCAGPMAWVQQQMSKGVNPRTVLTHILGSTYQIPEGVSDFMLWHIIINMLSEPPRRDRLRHINTLDDVIRLIKMCRKVVVLTGAGVSVSCGIPDFRSKDGMYARLAVDFPNLPDPQAMFDIHYFRKDPRPFFKFAKEIYPGQFTPSLCHRFIRRLEHQNKLLRNYTQNIDTLEQVAGITNVIQCHGSFATATCQKCSRKVDADVIKEDIFNQRIPKCSICIEKLAENRGNLQGSSTSFKLCVEPSNVFENCEERNKNTKDSHNDKPSSSRENWLPHRHSTPPTRDPIMKPNIVFFGEGLPDEFHDKMAEDKDECDLLIVIGSSLKVRPVALIPSSVSPNVPQILINREPLGHLTFDVELLGDCDIIVSELCRRLGENWNDLSNGNSLSEIHELPPRLDLGSKSDNIDSSFNNLQNAPHPKDESDIEALRACWAPKVKESMSARLPEGTFLFNGNHRYVFPGAEVYIDPDDEDTDSRSSDSESEFEDIEATITKESPTEAQVKEKVSFHSRLSSTESMSELDTPSSSLISMRRRSSQALSEDVDSLLSTSSCDPSNNTPDHPVEVNWGSSEPLSDLRCHIASVNSSEEDWTSLSASLDSSSMTSMTNQLEEGHYDGTVQDDHIEKFGNKEKNHQTECPV